MMGPSKLISYPPFYPLWWYELFAMSFVVQLAFPDIFNKNVQSSNPPIIEFSEKEEDNMYYL